MKLSIKYSNVGIHFGTVCVLRVGRRTVTSRICPYGFESAARMSALDGAVRLGLITPETAEVYA